MKKLLLKSILLLCALIVGSTSLWAAASDYSAVYTSNVTLSATGGTKATASTVVIGGSEYSAMKLGSSGNSGNFKVTFPSGTKYIHLHVAAWSGKNANTLSFSGISNYSPSSAITLTANTGVSGTSSTYTFATTGSNSAPNSSNHYKVITLTTALASNTEVTISCSERCLVWGVNAEALPTGVTIKNGNTTIDELDMTVGDDDVTLSATVEPTNAFQGVTWTSNAPGVATVTNGVVHAVAAGSATITAISTADNTKYAECTVNVAAASSPTATVSVTELDFGEVAVGGTKQMTFTVTPANLTGDLTIASNNAKYSVSPTSIAQATTTTQTITVTAVPTAANDDMDGQITISGGGIANKAVTLSATLYEVANVTLVATDDKGTFKQGDNVVTSITSRVGSSATVTAVPADGYLFDSWTATGATPASSTTATTEFTFTSTTPTLTANFIVDPRLFATLDGTDMTSMGANAYGTLKTLVKDGLEWQTTGYKDNTNSAMIQLKASTNPYIKLPEFSGNIHSITFSVTDANAASKSGSGTSGTLHFKTTTDGTSIVSGGGSTTNEIVLDISNIAQKYSTGYIVLTGNGARIWDITVAYIPTDINVSVTSAKYATFSDHIARDFSTSGITVLKAVPDGAGKVDLEEITDGIVPANEGVVLFSDDEVNNAAIPATKAAGTGVFTDNEMVANVVKTWITDDGGSSKVNYILSNGSNGVGFYKAKDTGANLAAHRAYLSTAATAGARDYLEFSFGETTGITKVENTKQNVEGYYNLNGQRIANPTKGLYIVNGKKVVIK